MVVTNDITYSLEKNFREFSSNGGAGDPFISELFFECYDYYLFILYY